MAGGRVPFDNHGTLMIPKLPMRNIVGEFLRHRHVIEKNTEDPDSFLREHLVGKV